jgi:uncharacterized Fe-S radical SAM superfamily protein PflX
MQSEYVSVCVVCAIIDPQVTKFFNVCCYDQVFIQNSEIDGMNGQNEKYKPGEKATTTKNEKDSTLTLL